MLTKRILRHFLSRFLQQFFVVYFSLAFVFVSINFFEKLDFLARFQASVLDGIILASLEFWMFSDLMLILAASSATGLFMFSISASNELKAYRSLGYRTQNIQNLVLGAIAFVVIIVFPIIDLTQISAQRKYEQINRKVRGEMDAIKDLAIVENNWLVFAKTYRPKVRSLRQVFAFEIDDGKPTTVIHASVGAVEPHSKMLIIEVEKIANLNFNPNFSAVVQRARGSMSRIIPVQLSDANIYGLQQRLPIYQLSQKMSETGVLTSTRERARAILWFKINLSIFGPGLAALLAFWFCTLKPWISIFPFILAGAFGVIGFLGTNVVISSAAKSLSLNPAILPAVSALIMVILILANRNR